MARSFYPAHTTVIPTPVGNFDASGGMGSFHRHKYGALGRHNFEGWYQDGLQPKFKKDKRGKRIYPPQHVLFWAYLVSYYSSEQAAVRAVNDVKLPVRPAAGLGTVGRMLVTTGRHNYATFAVFYRGSVVVEQFCSVAASVKQKYGKTLDRYCTKQRLELAQRLLAHVLTPTPVPSGTGSAVATSTSTPSAWPFAGAVDRYLKRLTKKGKFSGTALIALGDRAVFNKGYGYADWSHKRPNRATTEFRLASLTKEFTAAAILQLQMRGKLSVHDALCTYIDSCPTAWKNITIHELLTHRSGIPDVFQDDVPGFHLTQPYSPQQIVDLVRNLPLLSPPGTEFHYSNTGYDILGYIIEKVSGQTYGAYMRDNIFQPLGMAHTGVTADNVPLPDLAIGYGDGLHIQAPVFDQTTAYSSAGMYSTTGDLDLWDASIEHATLLDKMSLDQMLTIQYPGSTGYGYGWHLTSFAGYGRVAWHDGVYGGVRTWNEVFLDRDVFIVILSNYTSADLHSMAARLSGYAFAPAP